MCLKVNQRIVFTPTTSTTSQDPSSYKIFGDNDQIESQGLFLRSRVEVWEVSRVPFYTKINSLILKPIELRVYKFDRRTDVHERRTWESSTRDGGLYYVYRTKI